jgi:hypothetical protein
VDVAAWRRKQLNHCLLELLRKNGSETTVAELVHRKKESIFFLYKTNGFFVTKQKKLLCSNPGPSVHQPHYTALVKKQNKIDKKREERE